MTLGARPAILLIENDQNLVRRRALAVRAEQDFASAATRSRCTCATARAPRWSSRPRRLPPDATALAGIALAARVAQPVERPDDRSIPTRIDQSTARLMLAENDLSPRLDLRGDVGKDIGAVGPGGASRTPLEAVVGFRFSVPLENRAATGRVAEARAEIDALGQRSRFLRDQITVEVEGIVIAAGQPSGWPSSRRRSAAWRIASPPPNAAASSWDRATSSSSTNAKRPRPTPAAD